MQAGSLKRGEMSQASARTRPHQNDVASDASEKTKKAFTSLSASTLGLELGLSVVIGVLFGMWLDRQAGTSPLFMIIFLVLGLVAGFRSILRAARRTERAERTGHLG